MHVFLDFEASSLSDDSYPIEVGWVFEDGRGEAHLIRPVADWTDWNPRAEALHKISREALAADGEPVEAVAQRILDQLADHSVYASAPSWDGKWLSVLFRAAGLPRHAMRLRDTDFAQVEAVRVLLEPLVPATELKPRVEAVVQRARDIAAYKPVKHRALPDAEHERQVWLEVRRQAEVEAARLRA
jgi:hypothetical protein